MAFKFVQVTKINTRTNGKYNVSYLSSPSSLLRAALIVTSLIVCASSLFIIRPSYWDYFQSLFIDEYEYYASVSGIAAVVSIILYVGHVLRLYEKLLLHWKKIILISNGLFALIFLINGIIMATRASKFKFNLFIDSGAFSVASAFSFVSVVLFVIDTILWTRPTINI